MKPKAQIKTKIWETKDPEQWAEKYMSIVRLFTLFLIINLLSNIFIGPLYLLIINAFPIILSLIITISYNRRKTKDEPTTTKNTDKQ